MAYTNAQNEAPTARGNQRQGKHESDPNQCQGIRSASRADGNQPVGVNRADWERGDPIGCWSGGLVTGGILTQLIDEAQQELAECDDTRKKSAIAYSCSRHS